MRLEAAGLALALAFAAVPAFADDTIKIGYIDPLSGGGASVGEVGLKTFQYLADEINASGGLLGKKVEIVGLDNKTNPQESLIQAQKAADEGIRIITQGNGSAVGAALSDWVTKYNDRNPGKEMHLSQLRRGRSGADQRQMLLLAFPLGRQFRHQDGAR